MRGSWRLRTWRGMAYESMESVLSRRFRPSNYVVINGFWRSGTTWVQEVVADALRAKCVYEPFESSNRPFVRYSKGLDLPRRDRPFINALFPYAGASLGADPALSALVRRALAGGWYGIWSPLKPPYSERTLADALRGRIVTKFVRANLCLGAIQEAFGVPVIHVFRDPRAVVASLTHPDPSWGGGTFLDFPLRALLLEVGDGREAVFSKWRGEIEEIDKMPNLARIAAYHCLTEWSLRQTLDTDPRRGLSIGYASLLRHGFAPVFEFLEARGFAVDRAGIDVQRPSVSDKRTGDRDRPPSTDERLSGWRRVLSQEDTDRVTSMARHFGLAERCDS